MPGVFDFGDYFAPLQKEHRSDHHFAHVPQLAKGLFSLDLRGRFSAHSLGNASSHPTMASPTPAPRDIPPRLLSGGDFSRQKVHAHQCLESDSTFQLGNILSENCFKCQPI
jgi:hypothetical protein